jgi:hypothetical protein
VYIPGWPGRVGGFSRGFNEACPIDNLAHAYSTFIVTLSFIHSPNANKAETFEDLSLPRSDVHVNMSQTQPRQNYHAESEGALNKQINLELYSSYVYQCMVSVRVHVLHRIVYVRV